MSEDFSKEVKRLLAAGKGDAKRMREILEMIKRNDPVYMSDYKYIQSLISEESEKDKTENKDASSDIKLEDPLALLRLRLAEGKITIDEFRELKKTISEF
ncbi:MAG TPA: hypothetical protein VJ771_04105 [Candidatus Nitrosotalea sp.]|nr:hypothetical protein [Candidatus Nitrosotalea sp.]